MQRSVDGEVIVNLRRTAQRHVIGGRDGHPVRSGCRASKDVLILLDSITRLARLPP
jgi:transcription termination factor Rho